jgi:hypothetical protein
MCLGVPLGGIVRPLSLAERAARRDNEPNRAGRYGSATCRSR